MRSQAVWCILLFALVTGANAKTIDLKQAIDHALVHHIDLKCREADREVRWHELTILQQKFSPQISLSMSGTIHHEEYFNEQFDEQKLHAYPTLKLFTPIGTVIELFSEQNIGNEKGQRRAGAAVRLSIEQPLIKGRRKIVNTWPIESAKILEDIEALVYQKTVENIIYHVIVAYHTVLVQNKKCLMAKNWEEQSTQFYDILKAKWEAGRIPLNDIEAARFQLKQAEIQLLQADFEWNQTMRNFCLLIGEEEAVELKEAPEGEAAIPFNQIEKWHHIATQNDLEARIFSLRMDKLEKELEIAKDQQRIELQWRANATLGRYHIFGNLDETNQSDDYTYSFPFVHQNGNYSTELQISIPLTGKASRFHQELTVRTAIQKLRFEEIQHQQLLCDKIHDLIEEAALVQKQRQLSQDSVEHLKKNYQHALLKYETGRTAWFEVELMQEKWQEAEKQAFSQEIFYYNTLAKVEHYAGLLGSKYGH